MRASCPCLGIRSAARAVTHLYDAVLSPTGLKTPQFLILRRIGAAGEIAQWQLAAELCVGVDTLTRRLSVLKRKGWLEMSTGSHRHEHLYRLTPAGAQRVSKAEPHWERAQQRLLATLGEDKWQQVTALASELAKAANLAETLRRPNLTDSIAKKLNTSNRPVTLNRHSG